MRALTASGKHRSFDLAVSHHRNVIVSWASCIWDGLPELDMMHITLEHAEKVAYLQEAKARGDGPSGHAPSDSGQAGLVGRVG